jgi:hypothetical protein
MKRRGQGDACVRGKRRGASRRRQGHLKLPELAWRTVGTCRRRREIPHGLVDEIERKQREKRAEVLGYL